MTESGRVTLRDVYSATAALEAKMDKRFDEMTKILSGYDTRVSTLEIWRANISGKITLAIAIFSLAFTVAWDYLRRNL